MNPLNLKFGAALCVAAMASGCVFEPDSGVPVTLGVVATTMLPTGSATADDDTSAPAPALALHRRVASLSPADQPRAR